MASSSVSPAPTLSCLWPTRGSERLAGWGGVREDRVTLLVLLVVDAYKISKIGSTFNMTYDQHHTMHCIHSVETVTFASFLSLLQYL